METIRANQRREIIDLDKNISRQSFRKAFEAVQTYADTYAPPTKIEKQIAFDIEKYLIEMESILTEIQADLDRQLEPLEQKVLEQAVESPVQPVVPSNPVVSQDQKETEQSEQQVEGSGKCGGRIPIKGGVREARLNLLEVWNKFVNYLQKIARVGEFTQNDFLVLYDRLDDLVPILSNIQSLNRDAESINVKPIASDAINLLLQKIVNKDLSPIVPSRDFKAFLPAQQATRFQNEIDRLKQLETQVLDNRELNAFGELIENQRKYIRKKEKIVPQTTSIIKDIEKARRKEEDLISRYNNTVRSKLTKEDVKSKIKQLERQVRLGTPALVKSSRQSRVRIQGSGMTAVSNILNNLGEDVYKISEAIPEMSYDQLEKLYVKLFEARQFAHNENDKETFDKMNFLINKVQTDPRAKDIEQILGSGKANNMKLRYGKNQPLMFDDNRNDAFTAR